MRELDFSESNLLFRWLGFKGIWDQIQGEVQRGVKRSLERIMQAELRDQVGCERYERRKSRCGYPAKAGGLRQRPAYQLWLD